MNCVLTIPIPHFYSFYSATKLTTKIEVHEHKPGMIPIYSIAVFDIPDVDENGWIRAAITDYCTDKGDTYMDLSSTFTGENVLAKSINHDLAQGVSPSHFINVKAYYDDDIAKACPIKMDWKTKRAIFLNGEQEERIIHIGVYYDRKYINELDIELSNYHNNRLSE